MKHLYLKSYAQTLLIDVVLNKKKGEYDDTL